MATMRLTGLLHSRSERTWQATEKRSAGSIPIAKVQLSAFSYTEVTLDDSIVDRVARMQLGEPIDLVVSVEASGNFLRAQAVDFWPDQIAAGKPSAAKVG